MTKLRISFTRRLILAASMMAALLVSLTLSGLAAPSASAAEPVRYTVSGPVTARTDASFTLRLPGHDSPTFLATLRVTPATKFLRDGKLVSYAELKVGMAVTAVVQLGANRMYDAVYVTLPAAPKTTEPRQVTMYGTVVYATNTGFVLKSGDKQTTIYYTSDTKFFRGDKAVGASDLKVGMLIGLLASASDANGQTTYKALKVFLPVSTSH